MNRALAMAQDPIPGGHSPVATIPHILVPTDFSPFAERAARYACALASDNNAIVHFVYVMDFSQGENASRFPNGIVLNTVAIQAHNRLQRLAAQATHQGVLAESHLLYGDPTLEIMRLALEWPDAIIVMATHGRSGYEKCIFGGTWEKVLHVSPVPVLSVKHPDWEFIAAEKDGIKLRKILVPCDLSPLSQSALPLAAQLCRRLGASLVLAHVVEKRYDFPDFLPELALAFVDEKSKPAPMLERLEARHHLRDIAVEDVVLNGTPHRELLRLINETQAGLVVMATHGRQNSVPVLFGSVAEKMVRSVPCPILTVRPMAVPAFEKPPALKLAPANRFQFS